MSRRGSNNDGPIAAMVDMMFGAVGVGAVFFLVFAVSAAIGLKSTEERDDWIFVRCDEEHQIGLIIGNDQYTIENGIGYFPGVEIYRGESKSSTVGLTGSPASFWMIHCTAKDIRAGIKIWMAETHGAPTPPNVIVKISRSATKDSTSDKEYTLFRDDFYVANMTMQQALTGDESSQSVGITVAATGQPEANLIPEYQLTKPTEYDTELDLVLDEARARSIGVEFGRLNGLLKFYTKYESDRDSNESKLLLNAITLDGAIDTNDRRQDHEILQKTIRTWIANNVLQPLASNVPEFGRGAHIGHLCVFEPDNAGRALILPLSKDFARFGLSILADNATFLLRIKNPSSDSPVVSNSVPLALTQKLKQRIVAPFSKDSDHPLPLVTVRQIMELIPQQHAGLEWIVLGEDQAVYKRTGQVHDSGLGPIELLTPTAADLSFFIGQQRSVIENVNPVVKTKNVYAAEMAAATIWAGQSESTSFFKLRQDPNLWIKSE